MQQSRVSGRGRAVRLGLQAAGFVVGLGLLGWCISLALKPENREQFQKLSDASPAQIGGLLLLSLIYLNINGLIFWLVLRPARALRAVDVLAVNAVATFLAYLPFKVSAIVRIAIHNRRDRVPLLTIGSWFMATAVLMLVAILPAAGAAVLWQQVDLVWLLLTVAGQALLGGVLLIVARVFRGESGQARLAGMVGRLRVQMLNRFLGSRIWTNLHAGFDMLASPQAVIGSTALRLLDIGVQGARFVLAASIFGIILPFDQALLISLAYFIVGVLSPAGVVGTREAAAIVMAKSLGADIADEAGAIAAVLLVSATEAIAFLFAAGLGVAWLRPDRLLKRGDGEVSARSNAGDRAMELSGPVQAAEKS